jgi:hypothetical protein
MIHFAELALAVLLFLVASVSLAQVFKSDKVGVASFTALLLLMLVIV